MRTPKLSGRWRLVVAFAVFALVAAACGDDDATTTSAPGATTTTAGGTTTPTTQPPTGGFVYKTGIFQDTTTDNFWAYVDPASTVWNAYVLGPTKPALFGVNYPGLELTNDVAVSEDPGVAAADGDGFSVTVAIRDDAAWSDGTPITANDVVFTAQTVFDFCLGGGWNDSYQWALRDDPDTEGCQRTIESEAIGLTNVEAIDDQTVKFTWNLLPGLAIWPHGPGLAAIMPEHFWGPVVAEASGSDDPAEVLYAASGVGDPSGGTTVFDSREAGAFARTLANDTYYDKGREIISGGVTYTTGPFMSEQTFNLYGDQTAAVLALKAGDVDFLYNPLGLQRGLLDQIIGDPNLTSFTNATNGFRYMAFNLRREPMSKQGFRDAVAFMLDKEYVANSVLGGVAFPLYATLPEGNANWYNEEVADGFAEIYVNASTDVRHDGESFFVIGEDEEGNPIVTEETYTATGAEARLHLAVAALKADGFSWPEGQEPDFADLAIVPGSGIMLDGTPLTQQLVILAPGPAYDPLRATYSLIIAQALLDLGFNARAKPTDFNVLVDAVFVPDDAGNLDYDMFLLGWSLGNPVLPTYHESFWAAKNDTLVNDGNNNTGFDNADFNALVEEFNVAQTFEEAYDIMWQMEQILFEVKPYIVLFDTGIIEAIRTASVSFPFLESLSGLQFGNGFPGIVAAA
ncbi:MAG: ABC transporter substrate-binding protein [Actinomycetota bacterium]|nr:ABC transporter substrate-binding protein [Actinomycetota bacterium]